jgi:signal transduction histidine kinase
MAMKRTSPKLAVFAVAMVAIIAFAPAKKKSTTTDDEAIALIRNAASATLIPLLQRLAEASVPRCLAIIHTAKALPGPITIGQFADMLREDPDVKALLVDVLPIYNELNSAFDALKDEILQATGHDISTPTYVVQGAVRTMMKPSLIELFEPLYTEAEELWHLMTTQTPPESFLNEIHEVVEKLLGADYL